MNSQLDIIVNDLYKTRKFHEVMDFKYERGSPVYQEQEARFLMSSNSPIFQDRPSWSIMQMINYCTGESKDTKKIEFLRALLRWNTPSNENYDPRIDSYIEEKSSGKYTRDRLLSRSENLGEPLAKDVYMKAHVLAELTNLSHEQIYGLAQTVEDVRTMRGVFEFNLKTLVPALKISGHAKTADILEKRYWMTIDRK